MTNTFVDVCVIGSGLAGSSAAYELSRRGLRVALFEQFELAHDRGSSHGQARIFRLAYDSPDYVTLARRALDGWHELQDASGQILLQTTGGVDVGPPERLESIQEALTDAHSDSERLTRTSASQRFPWIEVPNGWEVLYQRDAGMLLADKCLTALVGLARAAGTVIHEGVRVSHIDNQGSSVLVESSNGTTHAQLVVITAGGWANELLEPLGLRVPIRVTREHVAYFESRLGAKPGPFIWHPSNSFEYYGLPNGTDPVMKVGQHLAGPKTIAGTYAEPEASRTGDIARFVAESLPGVDPRPVRAETCLYASTPDDDFVIDRTGSVILGVGLGGHGFKFGPQVGSMLADLAQGKDIEFASRFSLSRFSEDIPYAG